MLLSEELELLELPELLVLSVSSISLTICPLFLAPLFTFGSFEVSVFVLLVAGLVSKLSFFECCIVQIVVGGDIIVV